MNTADTDADVRQSDRPVSPPSLRRRRVAAAVCLMVVVAGAAALVSYRQFVLSDAESPLVLGQRDEPVVEDAPASSDVSTIVEDTIAASDDSTVVGDSTAALDFSAVVEDVLRSSAWVTTEGSIVGYRVDEVVAGVLDETVTGRTNAVEGTVIIDDSQLVGATFEVDMTTLDSGSSARDAALERSELDTDRFPTATFVLGEPVGLGANSTASVTVAGSLTLRGQTAAVEVQIDARIIDNELQVLGTMPIDFDTYEIDLTPPGVSIENTQAEFSLILTATEA